jgi:hypothetical protein
MDFGSETHWQRLMGRALLSQMHTSALDFVLEQLSPIPEPHLNPLFDQKN